jgi:uncharacterized YigZ family protein
MVGVRVRCREVLVNIANRLAFFDAKVHQSAGIQHTLRHVANTRQYWTIRAFETRVNSMAGSGNRESYETLDCDMFKVETEVKKSRFVAIAWPVASGEEAMDKIQHYKDLSASHNCYAFRVGDNVRSQDDGEPGGTAGRPILSAIEGQGLDQVCVLVIRYFGGIKLGTGGLVRAYSGAARACLEQAPRKVVVPKIEIKLLAPFESLGLIYQLSEAFSAGVMESDFENCEDNKALMTLTVDENKATPLCEALLEGSSGRISILSPLSPA